jgi:hypothetical protein
MRPGSLWFPRANPGTRPGRARTPQAAFLPCTPVTSVRATRSNIRTIREVPSQPDLSALEHLLERSARGHLGLPGRRPGRRRALRPAGLRRREGGGGTRRPWPNLVQHAPAVLPLNGCRTDARPAHPREPWQRTRRGRHNQRAHLRPGADIHVLRDDGSTFRDMPWGRDGNEFCKGHQCWRGRTSWAITSTGLR